MVKGVEWLRRGVTRTAAPTPAYTVYLPRELLSPVNCEMTQVLFPIGNGQWRVDGPERLCLSYGVAYRVCPDVTKPVPSDSAYAPWGSVVRGRMVENEAWFELPGNDFKKPKDIDVQIAQCLLPLDFVNQAAALTTAQPQRQSAPRNRSMSPFRACRTTACFRLSDGSNDR